MYAGVDPLTRREMRLRETCRTETAAQIALGKLLQQAAVGRQPESNVTVATLLDEYAAIAEWELSTREANEGYIRRTIKPALGHLQVRKVRGPILDKLYARLKRCSDPSCTGRPFTEHRRVPVLIAEPADSRPGWEQAAGRLRDAIAAGELAPANPLPSVRELNDLQGVRTATIQHAFAVLADERLIVLRHGRTAGSRWRSEHERRQWPSVASWPRSRLQAGWLPSARVQADEGQDHPEHSQHFVRGFHHGETLGLDRLEPCRIRQAPDRRGAGTARRPHQTTLRQ